MPLRGVDASCISQFKALSASSGSKVQSVRDGGAAKPLIQSENLAVENLVTQNLGIWSKQLPKCNPSHATPPTAPHESSVAFAVAPVAQSTPSELKRSSDAVDHHPCTPSNGCCTGTLPQRKRAHTERRPVAGLLANPPTVSRDCVPHAADDQTRLPARIGCPKLHSE